MNPGDRARPRTDDPESYEHDHERLRVSEAAVRDADDPVSGARPETDEVDPLAEQLSDEETGPEPGGRGA
jgi:hypothetical protein